jgi:hypothetical protein
LLKEEKMKTTIAQTSVENAKDAGLELGQSITQKLGSQPDALIVFASPKYDHKNLLQALQDECRPKVMMGASSAGEFTREVNGNGMACALAIRSDHIQFVAGVGRRLASDAAVAARQIVDAFRTVPEPGPFRAALIMTDALAGHADTLLDELTLASAGQYQFFGGGAGDDAQFQRTVVFHGTEVLTDAAVGLAFLSSKPIGIGVSHGWEPASKSFRVTEAEGLRLVSLNGLPAAEIFEEHAEGLKQILDRKAPIPFFLHNILGIQVGDAYRLRVPLAIDDQGAVLCAAEIPVGSRVSIMRSSVPSSVTAAEQAIDSALAALGSNKPKTALFFDCVASRLRMGSEFEAEIEAVKDRLAGVDMIGCNTHGQIARAAGQFEGFHNCTAVVCLLPE